MNNIPSNRNKSKDNPYTLGFNKEKNVYTVEFEDNNKLIRNVEITDKVYDAFDKFELEDISQIHKQRKHIERNEVYEETLYHRTLNTSPSVEDEVENKILKQELRKAIADLPEIQKRRLIKYFFEDKTYDDIASEENCTKMAVKFSIDIAIEKISKKLNI